MSRTNSYRDFFTLCPTPVLLSPWTHTQLHTPGKFENHPCRLFWGNTAWRGGTKIPIWVATRGGEIQKQIGEDRRGARSLHRVHPPLADFLTGRARWRLASAFPTHRDGDVELELACVHDGPAPLDRRVYQSGVPRRPPLSPLPLRSPPPVTPQARGRNPATYAIVDRRAGFAAVRITGGPLPLSPTERRWRQLRFVLRGRPARTPPLG